MVSTSLELPELQGEPEHVAAEKCKWASEQVNHRFLHIYVILLMNRNSPNSMQHNSQLMIADSDSKDFKN